MWRVADQPMNTACAFNLLALAAMLMGAGGCASQRFHIAIDDADAVTHSRLTRPEGQRIAAYVLRDGLKRRRFDGRARLVGDSLVLSTTPRSAWGLDPGRPSTELRMASAHVAAVVAARPDVHGPVYVVVGFGVLAALMYVALAGFYY